MSARNTLTSDSTSPNDRTTVPLFYLYPVKPISAMAVGECIAEMMVVLDKLECDGSDNCVHCIVADELNDIGDKAREALSYIRSKASSLYTNFDCRGL